MGAERIKSIAHGCIVSTTVQLQYNECSVTMVTHKQYYQCTARCCCSKLTCTCFEEILVPVLVKGNVHQTATETVVWEQQEDALQHIVDVRQVLE